MHVGNTEKLTEKTRTVREVSVEVCEKINTKRCTSYFQF